MYSFKIINHENRTSFNIKNVKDLVFIACGSSNQLVGWCWISTMSEVFIIRDKLALVHQAVLDILQNAPGGMSGRETKKQTTAIGRCN